MLRRPRRKDNPIKLFAAHHLPIVIIDSFRLIRSSPCFGCAPLHIATSNKANLTGQLESCPCMDVRDTPASDEAEPHHVLHAFPPKIGILEVNAGCRVPCRCPEEHAD